MSRKYYQISNFYPHLKHPEKYIAQNKQIVCRSSYEIKFAKWCDGNKNVLEWSSEEVVIPYYFEIDDKFHRYFVDYWLKILQKDNTVKEFLIEVKPFDQTKEPKKPKRKTKGYINNVVSWIRNSSKWEAAKNYCLKEQKNGRNIEFKIVTERDLNG